MSGSTSPRRRAFAPDQWARIQKSAGAAPPARLQSGFADDGKTPLPTISTTKPSRVVTRTKVVGVLEEGADGELYLASFESAEPAEPAPVAKAVGPDHDEVKTEKASWTSPVLKTDDDLRLVTGIVLAPETVDAQGDIYDEDVIKAAAHDYMREYNLGNVVGYMHKDMNRPLDLVESWLAPVDMAVEGRDIKKGTWIMTVHVVDKSAWDEVKKGGITGFSIGGIAKVVPVEPTAA